MDFPYAEIVARAVRDEDFKAAVMRRPKETLRKQLGVKLPKEVKVQVVVDSKKLVHLVIPKTAGLRGPEHGETKEFLQRVRKDGAYQNRLRRDPQAVVGEFLGFKLPAKPELKMVLETERRRVVHLPAVGAEGVTTVAEAQAFWGGGDDWEIKGTQFESGQACTCWTEDYELASDIPSCCIPETQTPGGGGGGRR